MIIELRTSSRVLLQARDGQAWRCEVPPVTHQNGGGWPLEMTILPFAFVTDVVTLPIRLPFHDLAQFAGTNL